jgi:hypothetical protein
LAGQRRAYLIKQLADFASSERLTTAMHTVVAHTKVRDSKVRADVALYLNPLLVLNAAEILLRGVVVSQRRYIAIRPARCCWICSNRWAAYRDY